MGGCENRRPAATKRRHTYFVEVESDFPTDGSDVDALAFVFELFGLNVSHKEVLVTLKSRGQNPIRWKSVSKELVHSKSV